MAKSSKKKRSLFGALRALRNMFSRSNKSKIARDIAENFATLNSPTPASAPSTRNRSAAVTAKPQPPAAPRPQPVAPEKTSVSTSTVSPPDTRKRRSAVTTRPTPPAMPRGAINNRETAPPPPPPPTYEPEVPLAVVIDQNRVPNARSQKGNHEEVKDEEWAEERAQVTEPPPAPNVPQAPPAPAVQPAAVAPAPKRNQEDLLKSIEKGTTLKKPLLNNPAPAPAVPIAPEVPIAPPAPQAPSAPVAPPLPVQPAPVAPAPVNPAPVQPAPIAPTAPAPATPAPKTQEGRGDLLASIQQGLTLKTAAQVKPLKEAPKDLLGSIREGVKLKSSNQQKPLKVKIEVENSNTMVLNPNFIPSNKASKSANQQGAKEEVSANEWEDDDMPSYKAPKVENQPSQLEGSEQASTEKLSPTQPQTWLKGALENKLKSESAEQTSTEKQTPKAQSWMTEGKSKDTFHAGLENLRKMVKDDDDDDNDNSWSPD